MNGALRVPLLRPQVPDWCAPEHGRIVIKESLPYFRTQYGSYVHRVRCAMIHKLAERPPHASFQCWCGMTGFISDKRAHNGRNGKLLAAPSATDTVCATCEGRAIGSGLFGTPLIDGQPVRFAPRIKGVHYPRQRPLTDGDWTPLPTPDDAGAELDVIIYRRDTGERI